MTWIDRTLDHLRQQARLGRLTPVEPEAIMNTTAALAACRETVANPCSKSQQFRWNTVKAAGLPMAFSSPAGRSYLDGVLHFREELSALCVQ